MSALKFRLVNEQVRLNAIRALEQALIDPSALLEVVIRPEAKARTDRQNRYLWGVVYRTIVDNDAGIFTADAIVTGLTAQGLKPIDLVHAYCKQHFLPPPTAYAVEDTVIYADNSTVSLSAYEFAQYVKDIQQHAAQTWGIHIPDPHACYALDYFGGGQ